MLSLDNWRKRLIFWCGAVIVGMIAAGYAFIADYAQEFFSDFVKFSVFLPFIISPLVFAVAAWLTAIYCPGAVGSGIPQAIAARVAQKPEERRYLLGPRIIIGKILFTTLGLLGGASIGREGPTVQIGAAILYLGASFGKVNAETSRSLILAGAAAGVAAAFNTPLAGIVFAIEEMARAFEHRYSGVVLTAIVLAGASSLSRTAVFPSAGTGWSSPSSASWEDFQAVCFPRYSSTARRVFMPCSKTANSIIRHCSRRCAA